MLMKDKKGLIMGVANERSIAWGIAKSIGKQGGQLAFTYQGEALKKRVLPLTESVGSDILIPCDVTDTSSTKKAFDIIDEDPKLYLPKNERIKKEFMKNYKNMLEFINIG